MTRDERKAVNEIKRENAKRYKALRAEYDPYICEGIPVDRHKLVISDYSIPVQWVPEDMYYTELVYEVAKAGSIAKFIETHDWKGSPPKFKDIANKITKLRLKHDFVFWCYYQIKVDDKELTGLVPFKLNFAQLHVYQECERLRRSNQPINIIICKARQWGGSTFSIFYQLWISLEWKDAHAFSVCAQVNGTAVSIVRMLNTAFQFYNTWELGIEGRIKMSLIPKTSEYEIKDSKDNQVRRNRIRIGSALEPDNLRGLPGSGVHFSEVAVWPDTPKAPAEDLVKSITGGILPRPYTMQVFESTPKGAGNYFHRKWLEAKQGVSGFTPIFIPWYLVPYDTLAIDDYDEFILWLYKHREEPHPNGKWRDSGKYYWRLWQLGATLEGLQWYRYKSLEFTDHADMASEAPSDDIEAFMFSGTKVFDVYHLEAMKRDCREPIKRGMLSSLAAKGAGVLKELRFVESKGGELKIWREPDREADISDRYLTVVDVGGRNQTSDWSVIRVFDRAAMMFGGKTELVAQLRYHTDYDLLAYDAMRLAYWYNNSLLVIESNTLETRDQDREVDGDMSQYILDIIGGLYDNLYARYGTPDSIKQGRARKWGWHTNTANKGPLIGNLIEAVREHSWIERDSACIDELAIYERNEKGQYAAPSGKGNHDDILMATAIGLWISFREMETPAWARPVGENVMVTGNTNSFAIF